MSDRTKGAALARKVGAPKTAEIIETACYRRIFQSAIEEIGTPKLVDALAEAKNGMWAYRALRNIHDLTEAQRTKLCKTIGACKIALWAYYALVDFHNLTKTQRTTLKATVVTTKNAELARYALDRIGDLTKAQRAALQKISPAA
jgi:hypothetical protein